MLDCWQLLSFAPLPLCPRQAEKKVQVLPTLLKGIQTTQFHSVLLWPHSNRSKIPGHSPFSAPSSHLGATWEAALLSPDSLIMGKTNWSYPLDVCVAHHSRLVNSTLGWGSTMFPQPQLRSSHLPFILEGRGQVSQ